MKSENLVLEIHHIAVQTSNLDKSLWFYCDVLGVEFVERKKFKKREMAWLKLGSVKIELFSKRQGEELNKWNDYISGPVHIAFKVKNFDLFLENVLSKGLTFHPSHPAPFVPPVAGAQRIAYLLGPDGEEVEIRGMNNEV